MNPKAFFDIETFQWTTFVLGAVHHVDAGTEVFHGPSGERAMLETLLAVEGEAWAHNGGRFDFLWLLDAMNRYGLRRPVSVTMSGAGIVKMAVGKTTFLDTYRLFPMPLRAFTDGKKGGISDLCECGKNCGGFCAVRPDASRAVLTQVAEYCALDCTAAVDAMDHFRGVAETLGIELGITVGSSAWKTARKDLDLDPAPLQKREWTWARRAYHGGRVEVFRSMSSAGHACDVNSMYPWALAATALPVSPRGLSFGSQATRDWVAGFPGLYIARVEVPDSFVPPLPLTVARGETPLPPGLAFPTGRFTGAWPRIELEHAVTNCGARILAIRAAVTFAREDFIFRPWVERIFDARMRYGKSSREGKWLKLVANSLTGKLGSRSERHNVVVYPDAAKLKICKCVRHPCQCGAHRPLDPQGRAWESVVSPSKVEPCAHVEWAAYLTGAARVKLHTQLTAGGADDAVYCDTDSCWSESPREGLGVALGEWEDKGSYRDFECLGPKTYHAQLAGKEETAAKGIPEKERVWAHVRSGEPTHYTTIRGLKGVRKGEPFFDVKPQSRRVTPNFGRRLPSTGSTTRAPRLP